MIVRQEHLRLGSSNMGRMDVHFRPGFVGIVGFGSVGNWRRGRNVWLAVSGGVVGGSEIVSCVRGVRRIWDDVLLVLCW